MLLLAINSSALQSDKSPSTVMVEGVCEVAKPPMVEVKKRSDNITALLRMA
jgi:hypothetical protein